MRTHHHVDYCHNCNKKTVHLAPSTNHILHLILSLLTAFFWVPVWICVCIFRNSRGECIECCGNLPDPKPRSYAIKAGRALANVFKRV